MAKSTITMDFIAREKTGAAIQREIDAAAAQGGGRVVLMPGVYPSGTVCLRSNTELHIPAGAKIQGSGKPELYDDFPHCRPSYAVRSPE